MSTYARKELKKTLVMLLAGGKGERLLPLTEERAKPAVPFGGIYRIIDFTISNCINSNLRQVYVLTQYKSMSLSRHIDMAYGIFNRELQEFVEVLPPQLRVGKNWYLGTADAVYQNLYTVERENPDHVLLLSGDHIYKMDYAQMLQEHIIRGADVSIACLQVPLQTAAGQLGVVEHDQDYRITGFQEKPQHPKPSPGSTDSCMVSMGIYIFNTKALIDHTSKDSKRDTSHDFGKDVIPAMLKEGCKLHCYPFQDENSPDDRNYWRDVGTVDAYWEANMDLCSVSPKLNLYDNNWPIRTYHAQLPPAKFVFAQADGEGSRRGTALDSLIANGTIISGGEVIRSVLAPNVRINSFSKVEDCVLMDRVEIGRYAKLRKVIVDKGVKIPPYIQIGYNLEQDSQRFTVSPNGVVVVKRDIRFDPGWVTDQDRVE